MARYHFLMQQAAQVAPPSTSTFIYPGSGSDVPGGNGVVSRSVTEAVPQFAGIDAATPAVTKHLQLMRTVAPVFSTEVQDPDPVQFDGVNIFALCSHSPSSI